MPEQLSQHIEPGEQVHSTFTIFKRWIKLNTSHLTALHHISGSRLSSSVKLSLIFLQQPEPDNQRNLNWADHIRHLATAGLKDAFNADDVIQLLQEAIDSEQFAYCDSFGMNPKEGGAEKSGNEHRGKEEKKGEEEKEGKKGEEEKEEKKGEEGKEGKKGEEEASLKPGEVLFVGPLHCEAVMVALLEHADSLKEKGVISKELYKLILVRCDVNSIHPHPSDPSTIVIESRLDRRI
jgi:hypothetical protein